MAATADKTKIIQAHKLKLLYIDGRGNMNEKKRQQPESRYITIIILGGLSQWK